MLSININYPKKVNLKSFTVTDNTIGFRPQTARVVLLFLSCNWELQDRWYSPKCLCLYLQSTKEQDFDSRMRDQVRNKLKKRKPEEDKEQSDVQTTKETSGKRLTKQLTALQFVEIFQKLTSRGSLVNYSASQIVGGHSPTAFVTRERNPQLSAFGGIPVCHSKPTFQAGARSLVLHAAVCQFVSRKLIVSLFVTKLNCLSLKHVCCYAFQNIFLS